MSDTMVVESPEITAGQRSQTTVSTSPADSFVQPVRRRLPPVSTTGTVLRPRARVAGSSLLLASLRQLDKSRIPGTRHDSEPPKSSQKEPGVSTGDSTSALLEAVFDVSDIDPLPFVNRFHKSTTPTNDVVAQAKSVAADRRNLPRRESECNVTICPLASDERPTADKIEWLIHSGKRRGQLIDVSMSGVALHLDEELAPGTRVILRISNRTIDRHVNALARVLRCRAESGTGWSVVCRFEKNLSFEQIHQIGRNLFAATIV
jgi:hypothetical protein